MPSRAFVLAKLIDSSNKVSTATLAYTPEDSANRGIASGYASLDSSSKVPSVQLPSYVDDVVEYNNYASLPATGESGKIYVTTDSNIVYRWSGSTYIQVGGSGGGSAYTWFTT